MSEELRIAIGYRTVDIPGLPVNRAQRIANEFAMCKLSRPTSGQIPAFVGLALK